jgi:hypothetical protein
MFSRVSQYIYDFSINLLPSGYLETNEGNLIFHNEKQDKCVIDIINNYNKISRGQDSKFLQLVEKFELLSSFPTRKYKTIKIESFCMFIKGFHLQ